MWRGELHLPSLFGTVFKVMVDLLCKLVEAVHSKQRCRRSCSHLHATENLSAAVTHPAINRDSNAHRGKFSDLSSVELYSISFCLSEL